MRQRPIIVPPDGFQIFQNLLLSGFECPASGHQGFEFLLLRLDRFMSKGISLLQSMAREVFPSSHKAAISGNSGAASPAMSSKPVSPDSFQVN